VLVLSQRTLTATSRHNTNLSGYECHCMTLIKCRLGASLTIPTLLSNQWDGMMVCLCFTLWSVNLSLPYIIYSCIYKSLLIALDYMTVISVSIDIIGPDLLQCSRALKALSYTLPICSFKILPSVNYGSLSHSIRSAGLHMMCQYIDP